MAATATRTSPAAQRLALLRDGTSVGCFVTSTRETHVVILEPNGHAYSYASPCGRVSRHLTPTLLSAHAETVAATLHFRNHFAWCAVDASCDHKAPYVHAAVGGSGGLHTRRRRRASSVTACWPQLDAYATARVWNDHEKAFVVESLDGTARVALHASGKVVDVRYEVAVRRADDDSGSSSEDLCAWVRQSFAVTSTPACFAWPVCMLLRARIARGSHADSFRMDTEELGDARSTVTLPGNAALDARPTFRPLFSDASTAHSRYDQDTSPVLSVDAIVRWARGLSRSLDGLVAVEQVGRVELVVVNQPSVPVAVLILSMETDAGDASRRSVIECERGFFRAFDADGSVTQQFTVETLPLELRTLSRDFQQTSAILHHAVELLEASIKVPHASQEPEWNEPSVTSTAVDAMQQLEDVSNELGRFRAFTDGSVRVVFADRTILQVSPSPSGTEDCSFIDREGKSSVCTSASASETQQRYIVMAMDFAQWAFATPEQRFRRYQLQQEQERLVAQELHKITIRQELNRDANVRNRVGDDCSARETATEEPLSLEAITHLQQETQKHMANIRTLLHGEGHAADTHRD